MKRKTKKSFNDVLFHDMFNIALSEYHYYSNKRKELFIFQLKKQPLNWNLELVKFLINKNESGVYDDIISKFNVKKISSRNLFYKKNLIKFLIKKRIKRILKSKDDLYKSSMLIKLFSYSNKKPNCIFKRYLNKIEIEEIFITNTFGVKDYFLKLGEKINEKEFLSLETAMSSFFIMNFNDAFKVYVSTLIKLIIQKGHHLVLPYSYNLVHKLYELIDNEKLVYLDLYNSGLVFKNSEDLNFINHENGNNLIMNEFSEYDNLQTIPSSFINDTESFINLHLELFNEENVIENSTKLILDSNDIEHFIEFLTNNSERNNLLKLSNLNLIFFMNFEKSENNVLIYKDFIYCLNRYKIIDIKNNGGLKNISILFSNYFKNIPGFGEHSWRDVFNRKSEVSTIFPESLLEKIKKHRKL